MTHELEGEKDIHKGDDELSDTDGKRGSAIARILSFLMIWVVCYLLTILFLLAFLGGAGHGGIVEITIVVLLVAFTHPLSAIMFIFGLLMGLKSVIEGFQEREYKLLWLSGLGGVVSGVSGILGFFLILNSGAGGFIGLA